MLSRCGGDGAHGLTTESILPELNGPTVALAASKIIDKPVFVMIDLDLAARRRDKRLR
tara:strand:+ start:95 stop:268 length:174 start_codon:yes stop_codon:yes gene_type:complete